MQPPSYGSSLQNAIMSRGWNGGSRMPVYRPSTIMGGVGGLVPPPPTSTPVSMGRALPATVIRQHSQLQQHQHQLPPHPAHSRLPTNCYIRPTHNNGPSLQHLRSGGQPPTPPAQPRTVSPSALVLQPNNVSKGQRSSSSPVDPNLVTRIDGASEKGIFGWTTVDGVNIPFLFRDKQKYLAVRMVEMKLLSKYPSTYPDELKKRPPLMSHYITESESKLLNEINMDHCAGEYGKHPFVTQDLIVKMSDFEDFYTIVKKHFPPSLLAQLPANQVVEKKANGGWVQINNTVVPYVVRGKAKYVPLSVIRYAAGLLTDIRVGGETCTEEECNFLNESCKAAGVDFNFKKTNKLVMLDVVQRLCSNTLNIMELPKDDPFSQAEFQALPEEEKQEDALTGGSMSLSTSQMPYPGIPMSSAVPTSRTIQNGAGMPSAAAGGPSVGTPQQQQPGIMPPGGQGVPYWMNQHLGIYPGMQGGFSGGPHTMRGPGRPPLATLHHQPGLPPHIQPQQQQQPQQGQFGSQPTNTGNAAMPGRNPNLSVHLPLNGTSAQLPKSAEVNNNSYLNAHRDQGSRRQSQEAMDLTKDNASPRERKDLSNPPTPSGTPLHRTLSASSLPQASPPVSRAGSAGSTGHQRTTPDGSPQILLHQQTAPGPTAPPTAPTAAAFTQPTIQLGPDGHPILTSTTPVPPPGHPGWHPMMSNPAEYQKMVQLMQLQAMAQHQQQQQQQLQQQLQLLEHQHLHQQRMKQELAMAKMSHRMIRPEGPRQPSPMQQMIIARSLSNGNAPYTTSNGVPVVASRGPVSTPPVQSTSSQKETSSRIERKEFQGKTLSCLVKEDGHYALVEALSRVYFPYCSLEDFQFALEKLLQVPLVRLTQDEEKSFIAFYNIPTKTLMCNKVIKLSEFKDYIPQLTYMFTEKGGYKDGAARDVSDSNSSSSSTTEDFRGGTKVITETLGKKISAALKAQFGKRPSSTDPENPDGSESPTPAKQPRVSLEEAVNRLKQFQAEQKGRRKGSRPARRIGSQSPSSDSPTEYCARSPALDGCLTDESTITEPMIGADDMDENIQLVGTSNETVVEPSEVGTMQGTEPADVSSGQAVLDTEIGSVEENKVAEISIVQTVGHSEVGNVQVIAPMQAGSMQEVEPTKVGGMQESEPKAMNSVPDVQATHVGYMQPLDFTKVDSIQIDDIEDRSMHATDSLHEESMQATPPTQTDSQQTVEYSQISGMQTVVPTQFDGGKAVEEMQDILPEVTEVVNVHQQTPDGNMQATEPETETDTLLEAEPSCEESPPELQEGKEQEVDCTHGNVFSPLGEDIKQAIEPSSIDNIQGDSLTYEGNVIGNYSSDEPLTSEVRLCNEAIPPVEAQGNIDNQTDENNDAVPECGLEGQPDEQPNFESEQTEEVEHRTTCKDTMDNFTETYHVRDKEDASNAPGVPVQCYPHDRGVPSECFEEDGPPPVSGEEKTVFEEGNSEGDLDDTDQPGLGPSENLEEITPNGISAFEDPTKETQEETCHQPGDSVALVGQDTTSTAYAPGPESDSQYASCVGGESSSAVLITEEKTLRMNVEPLPTIASEQNVSMQAPRSDVKDVVSDDTIVGQASCYKKPDTYMDDDDSGQIFRDLAAGHVGASDCPNLGSGAQKLAEGQEHEPTDLICLNRTEDDGKEKQDDEHATQTTTDVDHRDCTANSLPAPSDRSCILGLFGLDAANSPKDFSSDANDEEDETTITTFCGSYVEPGESNPDVQQDPTLLQLESTETSPEEDIPGQIESGHTLQTDGNIDMLTGDSTEVKPPLLPMHDRETGVEQNIIPDTFESNDQHSEFDAMEAQFDQTEGNLPESQASILAVAVKQVDPTPSMPQDLPNKGEHEAPPGECNNGPSVAEDRGDRSVEAEIPAPMQTDMNLDSGTTQVLEHDTDRLEVMDTDECFQQNDENNTNASIDISGVDEEHDGSGVDDGQAMEVDINIGTSLATESSTDPLPQDPIEKTVESRCDSTTMRDASLFNSGIDISTQNAISSVSTESTVADDQTDHVLTNVTDIPTTCTKESNTYSLGYEDETLPEEGSHSQENLEVDTKLHETDNSQITIDQYPVTVQAKSSTVEDTKVDVAMQGDEVPCNLHSDDTLPEVEEVARDCSDSTTKDVDDCLPEMVSDNPSGTNSEGFIENVHVDVVREQTNETVESASKPITSPESCETGLSATEEQTPTGLSQASLFVEITEKSVDDCNSAPGSSSPATKDITPNDQSSISTPETSDCVQPKDYGCKDVIAEADV